MRRLRAEKFSLVVDFQGYAETAFFARWTGAAERWGMVQRESRRRAFTKGFRRDDSLHIADWNRALRELRRFARCPLQCAIWNHSVPLASYLV